MLLTSILIQELKIVHLFRMQKYKDVVTVSFLRSGNQKSLQSTHNTKHKVESRDCFNYLLKIGVEVTRDDVEFLIKRFLYDSPHFKVKNPLRWDWKDNGYDSEDTHFESVDQKPSRQKLKPQTQNKSVPRKYDHNTPKQHSVKYKDHPYKESQTNEFKNFIKSKKSSSRGQPSKKYSRSNTVSQMLATK